MKVAWFAWYISGLLFLLAALTSLITYAPPAEHLALVLPAGFGVGAILAAGLAIVLSRLPPTHWAQRSRPIWAVLVAAVLTVTLLVAIVV